MHRHISIPGGFLLVYMMYSTTATMKPMKKTPNRTPNTTTKTPSTSVTKTSFNVVLSHSRDEIGLFLESAAILGGCPSQHHQWLGLRANRNINQLRRLVPRVIFSKHRFPFHRQSLHAFFLLSATMSFVALFGAKPWNYFVNAFFSFIFISATIHLVK